MRKKIIRNTLIILGAIFVSGIGTVTMANNYKLPNTMNEKVLQSVNPKKSCISIVKNSPLENWNDEATIDKVFGNYIDDLTYKYEYDKITERDLVISTGTLSTDKVENLKEDTKITLVYVVDSESQQFVIDQLYLNDSKVMGYDEDDILNSIIEESYNSYMAQNVKKQNKKSSMTKEDEKKAIEHAFTETTKKGNNPEADKVRDEIEQISNQEVKQVDMSDSSEAPKTNNDASVQGLIVNPNAYVASSSDDELYEVVKKSKFYDGKMIEEKFANARFYNLERSNDGADIFRVKVQVNYSDSKSHVFTIDFYIRRNVFEITSCMENDPTKQAQGPQACSRQLNNQEIRNILELQY